jgi:hypothetical protein
LDVKAVCGYDSDFFVLGCPTILFGQGLQGVLSKFTWDAAGDELERKTDHILGKLSAKASQSIVSAMNTYTVERVVQLTAVYSDNDYVKYEGIGSGKLAAAWKHMVDSNAPEATLQSFAQSLALHIPSDTSLTWLQGKNIAHELVRRAERAAFMFFGQPVLYGAKLLLPALPHWTEGCCSQLFATEPMSGDVLPGTTLSYELQRPEDDKDVLELVRFFNDFSIKNIVRWARGHFDIASADPSQLLVAPVPTLSSVHAVRACRPIEDAVKHLSRNEQKALARRLGIPLGTANDAERVELLRTNLALHRDSMTDGIIETRTECNPDCVAAVNKAKLK